MNVKSHIKKSKILIVLIFIIFLSAIRVASLPIANRQAAHQSEQDGYYDYQGVIHFHTNYSRDAAGTFEEIAATVNRQNVDFMISTDHNTLRPLEDKKEGWYKKTLILSGAEISLREGNLLALGIKQFTRKGTVEELISDIVHQGGMAIIAHQGYRKWKWKGKIESGITGEEVLDLADQWFTAPFLSIVKSLMFYPLNSSASFENLYARPVEVLKGWDRITQDRNMVGIYAPDFHQAIWLTKSYYLPFPRVETILPLAHDHVLLRTPFSGDFLEDKKALLEAIGKGHLYFSVDILEDATGFLFSARQENTTAWMGDQLKGGIPADFSVRLPASSGKQTVIHVYLNGEQILESREKELNFKSSRKGSYRIEVEMGIPTFWGIHKNVTWIYSNPIYLR